MTTIARPVIIYAESTPNPASMKFVADRMLIPDGLTAQYLTKAEANNSPLALKLFEFPFVKSVFFTANFVTLTKNDLIEWEDIILEMREFLKTYIEEGNPVVTTMPQKNPDINPDETSLVEFEEHASPNGEVETKIIDTLEQYVRPAVEQDGGLITFKSFQNGIVTVVLKGSCSGCPSSTLTLKAGIEGLLKRMVPEVKEVVAEAM